MLGVAPERVTVIPEGVDRSFSPRADPAPARRRHDLEAPYVLALATASERKNLGALDVTARVLRQRGIELVLAGSERGYLKNHAGSRLRRLGYVRESELPGLYAGALAFVMPSRYEGFGLPCLEAMACGVPVVAADAGALPETVGDAGMLVRPDDQDGFAAAVLAAILDQDVQKRLTTAGLERARRHDWNRTARLTDEAITRMLATH